jgi:pimeloyl-ACP methyl ester carboxylesterase
MTMTTHVEPVRPPSRFLLALELRTLPELGGFLASLPLLTAAAPRGDGHPVLVLPGLVTSDRSTIALRNFLKSRGYAAYGWELGRNYGPVPRIERGMIDRVEELYEKHRRKVSLVGWSLGGIYARQLAKAMPEKVRQVITLGSPFAGNPRSTNAWRLYEFTSGHRVDDREQHMGGAIASPPPCRRQQSTAARMVFAIGATAWSRKRRQQTISKSREAIAAWVTIRRLFMQSPTVWPNPKTAGKNLNAPASGRCFFLSRQALSAAERDGACPWRQPLPSA